MKAAVLKAPGALSIEDVPRPKCPSGGLLVEVKACGICRTDVKLFASGHRDVSYPRIPGHEIAGVVAESDCGGFREGDRVQVAPGIACGSCRYCAAGRDNLCEWIRIIGFTYDGGFAEYLAVPREAVAIGAVNRIPDSLSFEEATLAEPLACSINAQEGVRVGEGDSVLIIGAGPVGLLNVMLAKHRGASAVIVAEPIAERRAYALRAGADAAVEPGAVEEAIRRELGGRGVDVIIPACPEAFEQYRLLDLLAPGGRLSMFSGLVGEASLGRAELNKVHYMELELVGAYGCTARQNREALGLLASGLGAGWMITARLPLDRLLEGLRLAADRRGLKAVIAP